MPTDMTKREFYVGLIFAGLIAGQDYRLNEFDKASKDAMKFADHLLAALAVSDNAKP